MIKLIGNKKYYESIENQRALIQLITVFYLERLVLSQSPPMPIL